MGTTVDGTEVLLKEQLAAAYRRATAMRLNELSSGNLSVRCGEGMLISCSGADETITADQCVYVGPDGQYEGPYRPSSEWQMHWAVYAAHPSAGAVVHTHSDHAVAVSCTGKPLPGFHYLVGMFGGSDVPCVPYSTYGSDQLARDAAAALTDRSACLLASHGMICRAPDIDAALAVAQRLELLCRQYLLARQLGEPYLLTESEWREFAAKARAERYGSRG